ncbi:hypothetical protein, partial [Ruania rhizosphaerae]|uniref:hypothetical protein n=1 Tax=Ruania rhizosphaerae TaxID=1840413 RepID=UPI0013593464
MSNLIATIQDMSAGRRTARQRALRVMLAWAAADGRALNAVMREAAAERAGVLLLTVALAEAANANAKELAPTDWKEQ